MWGNYFGELDLVAHVGDSCVIVFVIVADKKTFSKSPFHGKDRQPVIVLLRSNFARRTVKIRLFSSSFVDFLHSVCHSDWRNCCRIALKSGIF